MRPTPAHKRRKCANDRHKARHNDRLATIFFIKLVGAIQIFFFKKWNISLKELEAKVVANQVVHRISGYRRDSQDDKQQHGVERPVAAASAPAANSSGVAWQKRRDNQAGLAKR